MQEKKSKVEQSFFALLRAGLWEQPVRLASFAPLDYDVLFRLAKEQSVIGLIAAGFEQVSDMEPGEDEVVPFMHKVLHQESRNEAMDAFIVKIVTQLKDAGIRAVLVKGQGVAQCYARPRWRACGDIDLFFDAENYEKAKTFLIPLATSVDPEERRKKHLAMMIEGWDVELHGLMPTEISARINEGVEQVQRDIFENKGVRIWNNGGTEVLLPNPDNDILIVFTHFLQHFFCGGVGLRQICDWCRLLWTYRDDIDQTQLLHRLREMGLVSEWKAFAAFAVDYLGMPSDAMPLYERRRSWSRKARRICRIVLEAGNMGHNKDNSYRSKYPKLVEKSITFFRRLGEYARLSTIFPLDAPRFFVTYVFRRTSAAL